MSAGASQLARRGHEGLGDSCALAGAAFVAYALLAAPTFYGDGPQLLLGCAHGSLDCINHPLFFRTVGRLALALGRVGVSLFDAFELLAALATACAVFCAHRLGLLLGVGRRRAALLALLCATSPGWVLFSGIIEMDGPYLGFAAVALLLQARLGLRGGIGRAVLAGVASGFAQGVHSTGAFLVPIAVPMWLLAAGGAAERTPLRMVRELGVLAGSHLLALVVAVKLLAPEFPLKGLVQHISAFGQGSAYPGSIATVARTFLSEGVLPFGLCVPALAWLWLRGRARATVLAFVLVLVGLVGFCAWVLWGECEYGAYLLPLMLPLAGLLVRELAVPAVVCLVLLGAGSGALVRNLVLAPRSELIDAATARTLVAGGPVIIWVQSHNEVVQIARQSPRSPSYLVSTMLAYAPTFEALRDVVDRMADPSKTFGMQLLVTAPALRWLENSGPTGRRLVQEHLHQAYSLQAVPGLGETMFWLRRR